MITDTGTMTPGTVPSGIFKNAIMLGMRFLVCTALMAAVYIIMALLIIHVMTPLIIFGMGTCAYINSILLKNIFIQLEGKAEGDAEGGDIHSRNGGSRQ